MGTCGVATQFQCSIEARRRTRIVDISAHRRADISSIRNVTEERASGRSIFTSGSLISCLSARQPEEATPLSILWQTLGPPLSLFASCSFPPCIFIFLLCSSFSYVTSNPRCTLYPHRSSLILFLRLKGKETSLWLNCKYYNVWLNWGLTDTDEICLENVL